MSIHFPIHPLILQRFQINTTNEFIHWYTYCVTQQPFELELTMPPTDKGKQGYSDEYVALMRTYL